MKNKGKRTTRRTKRKSKVSLRRKADILFSKYIRLRDKRCQLCGKQTQLQAAHVISRAVLRTRYDYDNCLTLCADCHLNWAHRNPLEFTEFIYKHLGEERYHSLIDKARHPEQMTVEKYEAVIKDLTERLNGT